MSVFIRCTVLIIVFCQAQALRARDVSELETLVVSAKRHETSGVPTATSIRIISREEILQSGADNLIQVLKGEGGVQVQDLFGDGSRSTVSMRGFGTNGGSNTLLLVDGRRLNNTDLKNPDLGFISLKDVDRIEIIQGSASVLYGDQAVGGAINIITRKTGSMNINAAIGVGSYDHQHQTINAANRFSNGTGIRLSAERRLSDNYRNQNRIGYDNLFLNVSHEWQGGSIFAELIHVDEDLQTPGAIFPQQIQVSRKVIGPFSLGDFNDTVSDTGRIGGNITLAPDWELAVEYTHRNEDVDGLISGTEFNQHRLARSFNPRVLGSLPLLSGDISIVLGADIENTEYKLMSGVGDTVNDQDMQAIYTLLTWQLNPRVSFTGGVRYARLENDNFKRDPFAAFPLPVDTFVNKTNEDEQTAESIGILFTPSNPFRFHVKRETSFRFPLSDELTGTLALFDDLKTQTGVSWEAGAEWNSGTLTARAVAYRLDLDNEIAFDPSLNLGVGANINLDSTRRNGLILELDYGPFDGLDAGVQYSWTDAGFEEGPFTGRQIPMVAEHQLQFSSNYEFLPDWNLYGELILISNRVAAGDFANVFPELPGYGVANLNLRYDNGRFSFSARINNVLDKQYSSLAATGFNPFIPGPFGFGGTDTGFFPAPERNFLFTIGYNYP